jgi:GntR family transcriptional repressor for pyruvate dehydrogenase complex
VATNEGGSRYAALRPMERPRLYEQLVERLVTLIREMALQPGDKLPPERELSAQLGVSRASVRQALVVLEVQGLVEVRHGEGAILRHTAPNRAVVAALRTHERRLRDVHDAREALEVKIAELAAARRTDADLEAIDDALQFMAGEVEAGDRGLGGDQRFHHAVTEAAHSPVLEDLMEQISDAIRETRIESLSQPGRPQKSLRSHRKIAEAIRAGDRRAAARAMRAHIGLVSDVELLRAEERQRGRA